MGDLLRAEGLVSARRRRRRVAAPGRALRPADAPNDVWCIDFKGWFRTRDGARCDPLTVTDAYSRYLLACVIVPPRTAAVGAAMERLFRCHGLSGDALGQRVALCRHRRGRPVAALGGLAQGGHRAGADRAGPAAGTGGHERMHRTLKAETTRPPRRAGRSQARFDRFREDFNENRPHEALGQRPPAAFWRPSPRPCPGRLEEPWYDAWHAVRRVRKDGSIKWGGEPVFISQPLARDGRHRRDRQRPLDRPLRRHRPRHRPPDQETSRLPRGPAGPRGSQTNRGYHPGVLPMGRQALPLPSGRGLG